jgi:ABC-2 type transport system ATP-binding protein
MFLDEPTLGLDPIARRDLWQVVRALRERHGVIVLSTHYLEEARTCATASRSSSGQIVEAGRLRALVEQLGAEVADLTVDGDTAPLLTPSRESRAR